MARNPVPVKPVESQSESGEEDNEGSSEEVEPQESDSAKAMQKESKPQPEEEEEFGSQSESESYGPDSNTKPLTSGQTKSKPNAPEPDPASPSRSVVAAKRRSEEDYATPTKDSKKKKIVVSETLEKKANLFQRLWSEDGEIVMLEGMIDFTTEKKSDPMVSTEEKMLSIGGEIYESGKGGLEWENEWNRLRVEERQLYLKQLEVRLAQANLVFRAMKRGDHQ